MEASVARYVALSSDHRVPLPLPIYHSISDPGIRHAHALQHHHFSEVRQKLHQDSTSVIHVFAAEVSRQRTFYTVEPDLAEPQHWKGEPSARPDEPWSRG